MRYFNVCDNIEKRMKKFYSFSDAKDEALRIMKIYIKLNNRVRCKQKDGNFYIFLEEENENKVQ